MVQLSWFAALPLIALLSTVVLVYVLFQKAKRNQSALIWTFMLIFFLLWAVGEFAQKWLGEDPAVLKWTALCIIFGDMYPAIFLIFTMVFPSPLEFFTNNRYLVLTLVLAPKVVSTIVSLTLGDFTAPQGWEGDFHYGYYPILTGLRHQVSPIGDWFFYFGLFHTFLLLTLGTAVLFWKYFHPKTESERGEVQLIFIGFAIFVLIGGSTGFLFPLFDMFPPELFSLGTLVMNVIVAYGLLQTGMLLFSPTVETKERKDYSDKLQIGNYYISSNEQAISTFTELVDHGYEGLYVGAIKPNLDITKFKRTPIVILTEAGKGLRQYGNLQYLPADELKTLKSSIFTFVKSASRGIILLDNMDLVLEGNWADPWEFVEMGMEMRDARVVNVIWLFGTPLMEGERVRTLKSVMEYPFIKKAILLDKLNSIYKKTNLSRMEIEESLRRLAKVEPIFGYIKHEDGRLVFTDDIGYFSGIITLDPTNPIRLFVTQVQTSISKEAYREILLELKKYGISRFEFLLRAGDSYIIEETFDEQGRTYEVYKDFLEKGMRGICITRTEPQKLKERYLLPIDSEVYWLTQDRKEEYDIKPAPEYLMVHIKNFIDRHGDEPGVILLDGLEYLITFMGDQFDSYLKVLRRISDLISQSKLILLIPYDPEAIPQERIALFRRSGMEVITRDMLG